jgi:isoquinoline 1-oxidoreductase subunit beta
MAMSSEFAVLKYRFIFYEVKTMGVKRRAFLIGGVSLVGGGIFGLNWAHNRATVQAAKLVTKGSETAFGVWIKIAADDIVTLYSPHVELGQGAHTVLAQMLAEELDADWSYMRVEQAPADPAFANAPIGAAVLDGALSPPKSLLAATGPLLSFAGRIVKFQPTWGSMTVAYTGQYGMRVVGAAVRKALIETAAEKLQVPQAELVAANSKVTHTASGRTLRYGELAAAAAARSLDGSPPLKSRAAYKIIGKDVARLDIPSKVDGSLKYGIDFELPDMRVATIAAAPVRGGKLISVDFAPAMAVKGVEKVVQLENAVVVVATGYWQAISGLRALEPKFTAGGSSKISSASIYADHDALLQSGKPTDTDESGARKTEAHFRLPYLHHASMEPFALTAHFKDGKLDIWGGLQDPLEARGKIAELSGLALESVAFHPQPIGGGFGRRNVGQAQIIDQIVKLAMQLPYPVKLIWSREEDIQQGCYRPQSSAKLTGTIDAKNMVSAISCDMIETGVGDDTGHRYNIPNFNMSDHAYKTNQEFGVWRSVNYSQLGFYVECFMDELAHLAGEDPYKFRRKHLKDGSREQIALDEAAKRSGWGTPLKKSVGRGIAIVSGHGSIVVQVVEASMSEAGKVKVHKVTCVVDCGTTVSPHNARGQVQGGIIMGLSAAISEAITLEGGKVQQSNFNDYRMFTLTDTPGIDVHFIENDAPIGGLGEPCLPPAAPALANALFAATGKRFRTLPMHTTV